MGQYYLKNINLFEAAQELDLLNLIGYDFAGPWTEIPGHQAQLSTPYGDGSPSLKIFCSNGVKYVLSRGFPANKLVLGIPAYARFFQARQGQDSHSLGAARSITRAFRQSGLRKHKLITR
jgi:chitinase